MYNNIIKLTGINGYLIVFVHLVLISCSGTHNIPDENILIQMEKTPCYGQCPVYTLKVDYQGKGQFHGVENTDYTGSYYFRLQKDELEQLKKSFLNAGFFEMEDKYHAYVSDLPTVYITYRLNGNAKKITDYYGAPKALKDLEAQIEKMVFSQKLKKTK